MYLIGIPNTFYTEHTNDWFHLSYSPIPIPYLLHVTLIEQNKSYI